MIGVSIIIPVFNQHQWMVDEAIMSCLNQTGDFDIDIVVVDDGSDTLTEWMQSPFLNNPNVRFFKMGSNKGVAAAWNYGIEQAKHELVCPMACDDLFHPDKLAIQHSFMNFHKVNFSYTMSRDYELDANNNIIKVGSFKLPSFDTIDGIKIFNELIKDDYGNCFINGATVMMTKEIFNKVGKYDERLRYTQDYDLWVRIAHDNDGVGIPFHLLTRRDHNNQATKTAREINDAELNYTQRRIIEYALIKSKWEESIFPITNSHAISGVEHLKGLGYK